MKGARLLILAPVLLALISLPTAAAPLHSAALRDFEAGPCAPGTAYDPACDVNHDGQITITDIQLTAGHWNQGGAWVSDNQHDHLGQGWFGNNVPLIIEGSFAAPEDAPLKLVNVAAYGNSLNIVSAYDGVFMDSVGNDAIYVTSAGDDGVFLQSVNDDAFVVGTAGDDGVYVGEAGNPSSVVFSTGSNGFEIAGAESFGLYVGRADGDGVRIRSTGDDAIQVGEDGAYPTYGMYVPSPGTLGATLLPNTANAAGQWALYTVDNIEAGNVFLSAQTLLAMAGADQPLSPGDVVTAIGLADPIPGALNRLALMTLANTERTHVVGVVSSRMTLQPAPGKDGEQVMHSTDGPARPGDYVAITVLGVAQVKVQDGEAIRPGQRLTVSATPGHARALRTVQVEDVSVDESGPTLGVALETINDGLVWVLVNPQ